MNCNCKEEIEAKLTERLKEQLPAGTDHGTELQGYGFTLGGNAMQVRGFIPVNQSAMVPLKSGAMKLKKSSLSMFFSFCPFCGVKA
jgi:hypothetical protein